MALLTLITIAAVYAGVSPRIAGPLYRSALFHPHHLANDFPVPEIGGVTGEDVYFGNDINLKLNGWFFRKPNSKRVVLISHGNGGNISVRPRLIEGILNDHLSVMMYDYAGYGKSEGLADVKDLVHTARSAYQYLIDKQGYKPEEIVLYGESLGAAVSIALADEVPVHALIVQSGFNGLRSIAIEKMPWLAIYPAMLFPDPKLNSAELLPHMKTPILVIHGVQDGLVPYHHGEDLYAAANPPKAMLTIQQAHHVDIVELWQQDFEEMIMKFLSEIEHNPNLTLRRNIS